MGPVVFPGSAWQRARREHTCRSMTAEDKAKWVARALDSPSLVPKLHLGTLLLGGNFVASRRWASGSYH